MESFPQRFYIGEKFIPRDLPVELAWFVHNEHASRSGFLSGPRAFARFGLCARPSRGRGLSRGL